MVSNPPAGRKQRMTAGDGRIRRAGDAAMGAHRGARSGEVPGLSGAWDLRDHQMAAAMAAEGALGRGRPAASGSRCSWYAARQDFSRSAAARLASGTAAARRPSLAPLARHTVSAPARTAPASTVTASADRPDGAARACTAGCQRSVSSASTKLASAESALVSVVSVTATSARSLRSHRHREAPAPPAYAAATARLSDPADTYDA